MKCDNDYLHRDKGNVFSVCVKLLGGSINCHLQWDAYTSCKYDIIVCCDTGDAD